MDEATWFQRIGGEHGISLLVDRFYQHMVELPEAADILAMHQDLDRAREKLWMFLVGRFGGPDLYVQKHGHPRLRARHFPFAIGDAEAGQWILCMNRALDERVADEDLREELRQFFVQVAAHMRNREG